ncbi:ATP-dependent DNA helicase RecG [Candidatus Saccharibacteria bacterium]|nr:ATP-dependent DNA helicase RecG [Candidatus Saccharibacteria bacterium]
MKLSTPLSDIKGVGEKTWLQLQAAGLVTAGDLIQFLPRTYEDYTKVSQISELHPGNVVVRGTISQISSRYVRRGLHVTTAVLSDGSGKVPMTWFNQPYRAKHLAGGGEWLVAGEFAFSQRRYQLLNPSVRSSEEVIESGNAIVPIYRQVSGLKSTQLRTFIEEIRPVITMLPELLPEQFVSHANLSTYADAMLALHFPENSSDVERGKQRIGFQELVELLYASELNRADNAALESYVIDFDLEAVKQFVAALPFRLTNDQRRAAWDIIQNFASGIPMNRLLQGDVGSGKTVVAGLAALVAARAGYQTAIMAPTELLARQHAETLAQLLEPFGVTVGLLIGSLHRKPKDQLKQQIAGGSIAVTVGTHALLQESVTFHQLGFVVIDEQHRFGVAQRQKLLGKGSKMPHLLAMTATPIPRSLQLTVYGELEVSLLQEKPVGRKPIITKIISPTSRTGLLANVDKEIEQGRQVYVVCPLIEEQEGGGKKEEGRKSQDTPASGGSRRGNSQTTFSVRQKNSLGVDREPGPEESESTNKKSETFWETNVVAGNLELASVAAEYERLQKTALKHRRIGLLHGKMAADEKDAVMRRFVAREIDVLVSTTVVEVGVDVPNATVMIIEGAERFGLAQLHQLRGRVGRSEHQSYCYLVTTESKQTTSLRLRELEHSNDGFYLAEKDLELRGPGEIYGRMQHGQLNLQVASLADTRAIVAVKRAIAWAKENGIDLLQYEGMRERVERYRRLTTLN